MWKYNNEIYTDLNKLTRDIENDIDVEGEYDDFLDEQGEIEVCGMFYMPSQILYSVDNVAYNCGYNGYVSNIISNIEDELDNMSDGDIYDCYGVEIEYIEEIEEDEEEEER